MKITLLLNLLILFCALSSNAQNQNIYAGNMQFQNFQFQNPEEEIHLAGMYMEKAANQYKISRILYVAASLTPVIFRLTRSGDSSTGAVGLLVGGSLGLVGLGFGFSGDINLKKGSGILHRIRLIN